MVAGGQKVSTDKQGKQNTQIEPTSEAEHSSTGLIKAVASKFWTEPTSVLNQQYHREANWLNQTKCEWTLSTSKALAAAAREALPGTTL
jgi:hypothetical protein